MTDTIVTVISVAAGAGGLALTLTRLIMVLTRIASRLATIEAKLDHRAPIIDGIEPRMRDIEKSIHARLDGHETRISHLEGERASA